MFGEMCQSSEKTMRGRVLYTSQLSKQFRQEEGGEEKSAEKLYMIKNKNTDGNIKKARNVYL